jgi:Chaperone of endosialidase
MNPLIQFKTTPPLLITVALLCFVLLPKVHAVVPPPDGGYPNLTTAEGQNALLSLTTGVANTAVGWSSLSSNTDGSYNTAVGAGTLLFNIGDQSAIEGVENTAVGAAGLLFNTTGFGNTAVGAAALLNNIDGSGNTAIGDSALLNHTTDDGNTAIGYHALLSDTTGNANTAYGTLALNSNTTGNLNVAIGALTLSSNTTGDFNVALGSGAGSNVTTADGVICIGAAGANVSNRCFIGNIYSTVQPIVGTDPDSVTINSNGRLGRGNVSSRRYKHDIQPMDKASEVLYALEPVSFRYNKEYDDKQTLAFGLIAEEVAEVYPDLVGRNPRGEPESVRYEQINAMLLNEFLKEHRKNEEQQKQINVLTAQLKEQAAQIQKVSGQLATASPSGGGLEASKFATGRIRGGGPAPQVVNNP